MEGKVVVGRIKLELAGHEHDEDIGLGSPILKTIIIQIQEAIFRPSIIFLNCMVRRQKGKAFGLKSYSRYLLTFSLICHQ